MGLLRQTKIQKTKEQIGDEPNLVEYILSLSVETKQIVTQADNNEKETTPAFLKPVHQEITHMGFVLAKLYDTGQIEVQECRAGGKEGVTEKALLSSFWSSFEKWKPTMVTFNGRGHIVPVLRFASMRHDLTAEYINKAGDKWSNYGSRYNPTMHLDMMDILSDQNGSIFPSLEEVAIASNIPFNITPEMSLRDSVVEKSSLVFQIFLKWKLFKGDISKTTYDNALTSLVEKMNTSKATTQESVQKPEMRMKFP